ncbi:MAG TPA: hypothetical protein VIY56_19475, partial [Vicinamibacterales bacterium]
MVKRIIVGLREDHPETPLPGETQRIDVGPDGAVELIPQGVEGDGIRWYSATLPDAANSDSILTRLTHLPQIAA